MAYILKTVWNRLLRLLGREDDEIRAELDQVRQQAEGLNIARGSEIEILEQIYVLAAKRQIQELALFRDYTFHYAQVDGWATEELAAVRALTRAKGKDQEKRTEPLLAYSELDPWREFLVRSFRLQAAGADREVKKTQEAALRETQEAMEGSAGGDLLSANLAEVQGLLLEAGVGRLCDGRHQDGDDPLVVEGAQPLKSPKAAAILRKAVWLGLDRTGGDNIPARTIGTVVRSLGEDQRSQETGAVGEPEAGFPLGPPGRSLASSSCFFLLGTWNCWIRKAATEAIIHDLVEGDPSLAAASVFGRGGVRLCVCHRESDGLSANRKNHVQVAERERDIAAQRVAICSLKANRTYHQFSTVF